MLKVVFENQLHYLIASFLLHFNIGKVQKSDAPFFSCIDSFEVIDLSLENGSFKVKTLSQKYLRNQLQKQTSSNVILRQTAEAQKCCTDSMLHWRFPVSVGPGNIDLYAFIKFFFSSFWWFVFPRFPVVILEKRREEYSNGGRERAVKTKMIDDVLLVIESILCESRFTFRILTPEAKWKNLEVSLTQRAQWQSRSWSSFFVHKQQQSMNPASSRFIHLFIPLPIPRLP